MKWKECPTFRRYVKAIDRKCFIIIEALNRTKTKNLSLIARETYMPPALVHYYYDKLARRGIVKLKTKINIRKIGLQPLELIIKQENIKTEEIEEQLKNVKYWRTITRYYTSKETYYHVILNIPTEKVKELKKDITVLEEKIKIKILTQNLNPIEVNPKSNFQWFNEEEKRWLFNWNEWINEEPKEREINLNPRKEEKVMLDEPDIFILKKLEENPDVTFKDLAKALGVTPPTIRYHYYKHLINYQILEGFEPTLYPYPKDLALDLIANIKFHTNEKIKTFIGSLENKPFTQRIWINPEQQAITMYIYLLIDQMPNFMEAMTILKEKEQIKKYTVGVIDKNRRYERSLPAELYEKGRWK